LKLDAYLRAHGFVNVERPPELWAVDVEETSLVHLTGEMLALALGRGNRLADLTMNASNMVVPPESAGDGMPAGEFVALTIKGQGAWGPDAKWWPQATSADGLLQGLEPALQGAAIPFAYVRDLGGKGGSVTIFLPRLGVAGSG
jgi:hypothetical protein